MWGAPSWEAGRSLGQRPSPRGGHAAALCKQRGEQLSVCQKRRINKICVEKRGGGGGGERDLIFLVP